jgi:hypothetical protein
MSKLSFSLRMADFMAVRLRRFAHSTKASARPISLPAVRIEWAIIKMRYDIYRGKYDRRLKLATRAGVGLPSQVAAEDWELNKTDVEHLPGDAVEHIASWGFCIFSESHHDPKSGRQTSEGDGAGG